MQRTLSSEVCWISVSDGLPPSRCRKQKLQTGPGKSQKELQGVLPMLQVRNQTGHTFGRHWKKATGAGQVHFVQLAKPTTSVGTQTVNE